MIFMWNQAKSSCRYSLVHPLPTSSSKSALKPSCFDDLYLKSSSRYSPVHFLSATFSDRGLQPRKQRPSFGDHGRHLPEKTTVFAPESLFKPEFRRSGAVTLPIYFLMMMMMCLTWWWECWPWQASVTRKFSNKTSFDLMGLMWPNHHPQMMIFRTPQAASSTYEQSPCK
jgi:hypothetical protein